MIVFVFGDVSGEVAAKTLGSTYGMVTRGVTRNPSPYNLEPRKKVQGVMKPYTFPAAVLLRADGWLLLLLYLHLSQLSLAASSENWRAKLRRGDEGIWQTLKSSWDKKNYWSTFIFTFQFKSFKLRTFHFSTRLEISLRLVHTFFFIQMYFFGTIHFGALIRDCLACWECYIVKRLIW